ASISGTGFGPVLSDDPDTTGTVGDPTLTLVGAAPSIQVTMADSLATDVNGDNLFDPGDTILYTVVITNSGDQDASGLTFSSAVGANTTLVAGSVTTTAGTASGAGGMVNVNVGTLAGAGGRVTITFKALIDNPVPPGVTQIQCQGTVSGG